MVHFQARAMLLLDKNPPRSDPLGINGQDPTHMRALSRCNCLPNLIGKTTTEPDGTIYHVALRMEVLDWPSTAEVVICVGNHTYPPIVT